jgi:iron complex transport system substrate-binding protein
LLILLALPNLWSQGQGERVTGEGRTITDSYGRSVEIGERIDHVICSGPGSLRLLAYLGAVDMAVAADSIESRNQEIDPRPYLLAHPELTELPVFGEFRGRDNPERILTLEPQPQVIFKTFPESGYEPELLAQRTGIPVITLNYGNLTFEREAFYQSLRIMADVIGRQERAEELIGYLEQVFDDLAERSEPYKGEHPSVFIGGIAYKGGQQITATDPVYPPLELIGARQMAFDPELRPDQQAHMQISREQLLSWDPELIFVDASTTVNSEELNAVSQLADQDVFGHLRAVRSGDIYLLLPYNWYTVNIGSAIADAYYLGKVLFPGGFADIDPAEKADEIYTSLLGDRVFSHINQMFDSHLFTSVGNMRHE